MHWGPRQEIYRVGPSRRSASIILRVWWKEGNIEIAYAGYFILLNLFIFLVCGILVPWPGLKPSPLHWMHRVLATGLPGKSLDHFKMWITGMGLGWIWGRHWWTSLEQILFSSERPRKERQIISIQGQEMRELSLLDALGWPRGSGWRGRREGGSGWGTHVNPWLFHFNVWQNPLQ